MFRKFTLVAVPAVAFAATLCGNADPASLAFAKDGGGSGSHGHNGGIRSREHRGMHRDFRYGRFGRYGWGGYSWGYPSCYGCAVLPVTLAEAPAPVVETPVVATAVCTTCAPAVSTCDGCGYWGYRRDFRRHDRFAGHFGHPGHGKK